MDLLLRARRAVPVLAAVAALGVAGCGKDDVKSGVDKGAEKAKDAGRDAEKAGKDAAEDAKKRAEDAKDKAKE